MPTDQDITSHTKEELRGSGNGKVRARAAPSLVGALAVVAGCLIAWIDTRPGWDDTGVTVGLIVLVASTCAVAGLRWWHTALLVAAPMILLEFRTLELGVFFVLGIAALAAVLGQTIRSIVFSPRTVGT